MAVEALRLAWLRAQRTALRHTVSRYADLQPHFNLASTLLLSSYRSLAQIPKCPGFLFFSLPFSAAICLEPPPSQTDVAPSVVMSERAFAGLCVCVCYELRSAAGSLSSLSRSHCELE